MAITPYQQLTGMSTQTLYGVIQNEFSHPEFKLAAQRILAGQAEYDEENPEPKDAKEDQPVLKPANSVTGFEAAEDNDMKPANSVTGLKNVEDDEMKPANSVTGMQSKDEEDHTPAVQKVDSPKYTDFKDTGFGGEDDPYGIVKEYLKDSPHPDAAKKK